MLNLIEFWIFIMVFPIFWAWHNDALLMMIGMIVMIQVVAKGAGGGEVWGLKARWHRLVGETFMCIEALLKQVRAYQVRALRVLKIFSWFGFALFELSASWTRLGVPFTLICLCRPDFQISYSWYERCRVRNGRAVQSNFGRLLRHACSWVKRIWNLVALCVGNGSFSRHKCFSGVL